MAIGACESAPLTPNPDHIQRDAALGRTIERDAGAAVQTDSLVYHFERQGDRYSVAIPFTYRNDTGRTISIVNCHGGLNIGLEKRIDGRWQAFYWPVLLMCLSQPITIARGATYASTARIAGALPGRNTVPDFASAELDGEYRLVWADLVHGYDSDRQDFGDRVGPLRSNPVLLVAPT
jgi:hypothetical protein